MYSVTNNIHHLFKGIKLEIALIGISIGGTRIECISLIGDVVVLTENIKIGIMLPV